MEKWMFFFVGDLRQLPPVRAKPIYTEVRDSLAGPVLWKELQYFKLEQVMRQNNIEFSAILTKIGYGIILKHQEQTLIESRFFAKEQVEILCPEGVRLFWKNTDVTTYNAKILSTAGTTVESVAIQQITGTSSDDELKEYNEKVLNMRSIDTGGVPYKTTFAVGFPYMLITNIDVADGLANGAVGELRHIEYNDGKLIRLWLKFPGVCNGRKTRAKFAGYAIHHNIDREAVPINMRHVTFSLNKK